MKNCYYFLFLLSFGLFSCHKVSEPIKKPPIHISKQFDKVIKKSATDTSLTFIVIGDWGKQSDSLVAVSDQMADVAEYLSVEFVLCAGDNFYNEGVASIDDPKWSIFNDNFNQSSLQVPFYISLGNHDHYGNIQAQIDYTYISDRWYLPSTFYSLNRAVSTSGDSLGLVVIDSHTLRIDEDQLNQHAWIDSVSQSLNTRWKIMLGHHPLYSYGDHGSDATMQLLIEDILYDNNIDVYVAGHDHDMQHIQSSGSTEFFISGAAATLRDTEMGPLSLFSLSEYGFLTIRLSHHLMECYFINKEGNVVYAYKRVKL